MRHPYITGVVPLKGIVGPKILLPLLLLGHELSRFLCPTIAIWHPTSRHLRAMSLLDHGLETLNHETNEASPF